MFLFHSHSIPSNGQAIITPLPKGGKASSVSNLRPISILPIVGKLQEALAHTYLSLYLEGKNLINECQFGYRKNCSTGEAGFNYMNDLFRNRDIGHYTAATYIDMRKAFDSIHHGLLLQKMSNIGMNFTFFWCLESYLSGREQQTKVDNIVSESHPIVMGIGC